jgi:SAM-dependent methyltransferase
MDQKVTYNMPFKIDDLYDAYLQYRNFISHKHRPHHERYIFPFFAGSYFAYRKVDVVRLISIANSISSTPTYVDVGCGYGDFLEKIREYLPDAIGIEKEGNMFYAFGRPRPSYIHFTAIERPGNQTCDLAFVGWMEPGVDFRKYVARFAKCIVTTFDEGGQCGIDGGCDYEEYGLDRIAWWRTPSWIDVNTELMNKYYTPSSILSEQTKHDLSLLRAAHNLWYIYARPSIANEVVAGLKLCAEKENEPYSKRQFNFESVLDECGFHYMEMLPSLPNKEKRLWEIMFD